MDNFPCIRNPLILYALSVHSRLTNIINKLFTDSNYHFLKKSILGMILKKKEYEHVISLAGE
jgi:hypothetical protein